MLEIEKARYYNGLSDTMKYKAYLKEALKDYKELTYNIRHDHIYIHLNGVPFESVRFAIEHTPGLLSYSLVESLPKDIEVITPSV